MKEKEKLEMNAARLADFLEQLARGLRNGTYSAGGRTFAVPDRFKVKVSVKERKGEMSSKIAFGWSTLESYGPDERQEVARWKDSFKSIKKRLAVSLKNLTGTAQSGVVPDEAALEEFLSDSRKFAEFAEPEWKAEMDEYMDHLANLATAAREKRLEAVRHELRDLTYRMKACHRDFK